MICYEICRYFNRTLLCLSESQTHVVHFLLEPEDLVADTNQSVLLHCAAQGVNEPKILWKKDGKLVQLSHGDPRRYMRQKINITSKRVSLVQVH